MIGGLAGHGKTWVMLAMVRALLEGGKLFHYFPGPLRTRLFASIRQTSYVFSGPSVLITTDLTSIPDWVMYTTYIEITIYRWPESGWKIVPGFLVRGPSGLFPIFDLLGTRTFLYSTSYVHGAAYTTEGFWMKTFAPLFLLFISVVAFADSGSTPQRASGSPT
jgi:hypothetical protein